MNPDYRLNDGIRSDFLHPAFEHFTFEKIEYHFGRSLDLQRLQGCDARVSDARIEELTHRLAVDVRLFLAGRRVEKAVVVSWPQDWREALKLRFGAYWFARWYVARHPVQMANRAVKTVEATIVCPHLRVDDTRTHVQFVIDKYDGFPGYEGGGAQGGSYP